MKHSVASVTYYDCVATLVESGAQQSAPGTETAVMNANTDGREQLDWIDVVSGDCRRDRDLREINAVMRRRVSHLLQFKLIELVLGHLPEPIVEGG